MGFRLTLVISLLLSLDLNAAIIETKHFESITGYATAHTFFILDIDNTLIEPVQDLGSHQWFCHRMAWYHLQGYEPGESLERALAEWEAVQNITASRTVEEAIPEIIVALQKEGHPIIGLTPRGLGMAKRTIFQLADLGIDLTKTAPFRHDIPLNQDHLILFRKGVLFTSGTHKGDSLFQLLDKMHYKVEKIVYINDKRQDLQEVEESCNQRKIPFIGLRYSYLDTKVKNFRPEISEIQFKSFQNILSNKAAEEKLKGH